MWYMKQNLKGPSIEIHYQFSNFGGVHWALKQNFRRVALDFQGPWALTGFQASESPEPGHRPPMSQLLNPLSQ